MGFWNFLCRFAALNALYNLFSNKQNQSGNYSQHHYIDYDNDDYTTYGGYGRCDLDDYRDELEDMQYELDDLRDELYDLESDCCPYDDFDY